MVWRPPWHSGGGFLAYVGLCARQRLHGLDAGRYQNEARWPAPGVVIHSANLRPGCPHKGAPGLRNGSTLLRSGEPDKVPSPLPHLIRRHCLAFVRCLQKRPSGTKLLLLGKASHGCL